MRICLAFIAVALSACIVTTPGPGGGTVDDPYEACFAGDSCTQGTLCYSTTLPASAGYTGSLCTNGCSVASDCLQLLSNYDAICVNSQCYIQCPTGNSTCPYGTGCITFSDQNGNGINICTP